MNTKVTLTTNEAILLIKPIITESIGLDFPNQLDITIEPTTHHISNADLLASKKIQLIKLVRQLTEDLLTGKVKASGQPDGLGGNKYLGLLEAKTYVENFFKD